MGAKDKPPAVEFDLTAAQDLHLRKWCKTFGQTRAGVGRMALLTFINWPGDLAEQVRPALPEKSGYGTGYKRGTQ